MDPDAFGSHRPAPVLVVRRLTMPGFARLGDDEIADTPLLRPR